MRARPQRCLRAGNAQICAELDPTCSDRAYGDSYSGDPDPDTGRAADRNRARLDPAGCRDAAAGEPHPACLPNGARAARWSGSLQ